jgi:hypothetical protein
MVPHPCFESGEFIPLLSLLLWPPLPTQCRCTGLLLHLIALDCTYIHTLPLSLSLSLSVGLLWTRIGFRRQHTTFTRERNPCPRRDSNSRSQQSNDRRPTSCTSAATGIGHSTTSNINYQTSIVIVFDLHQDTLCCFFASGWQTTDLHTFVYIPSKLQCFYLGDYVRFNDLRKSIVGNNQFITISFQL